MSADERGRTFIVLSPHPDDAVLSTWHVLDSAERVNVITVCAGLPRAGWVSSLDKAHGARDSAEWMQRRRNDDQAALEIAGRVPRHLDLLDIQYRAEADPRTRDALARDGVDNFLSIVGSYPELRLSDETLSSIAESLRADVVYGPLGIGGHPDHQDVGRIAAALFDADSEVRLYADSPYFLRFGLPSWIGGAPNSRADAIIDVELSRVRNYRPTVHLERQVVELNPTQVNRKLASFGCYTTEVGPVAADFRSVFETPALLHYEVYWTVR